jgi:poly-beta-1,6-N-acetyl-D-glucosamine synthase
VDFLTVFSALSVFILCVYILLFISLTYGYRRLAPEKETGILANLFISVIVPFRNEKERITGLLKSLIVQDYPSDSFEVLFVNDHSNDESTELIKSVYGSACNFTIMHLSGTESGKKAAVKKAISHANGELLLFTDADCVLPPGWLKTHASHFLKYHKPFLSIGLVEYAGKKGCLQRFLELEFQTLIAATFGASGLNRFIMCNGANLAVSASLYNHSTPDTKYDTFSGDDVFLLHAVKKTDKTRITPVLNQENSVKTLPPENFTEFIQQRIRWSSKTKYYEDRDTIILGMTVLFTNFIFVLSIIFSVIYSDIRLPVIIYLSKTLTDMVFMFRHLRFIHKLNLLWYMPLLQVMYPFYVTITGMMSLFVRYKWKGRTS